MICFVLPSHYVKYRNGRLLGLVEPVPIVVREGTMWFTMVDVRLDEIQTLEQHRKCEIKHSTSKQINVTV